jgi:glycosyltransferase involved in cell wall biosynthesis
MRICLFTPTFLPLVGGTEVVTDALAKCFHAAGHTVAVVALGDEQELDVPYDVIWYKKPHGLQWFPERTAKALKAAHAEHRFDVFCVNYGHPTGYGAVKLGAKLNVPVVVVSHGGDLYRSTKDRNRPHIWKRIEYAYREADGLIAISPYIGELIGEIAPDRDLVEYIPNGVEIEPLREPGQRPEDFDSDKPFVLCLGNLNHLKGFADAIAAYAAVHEQLGELQLVIVGDGELAEDLAARAADTGLGSAIRLMGRRVGNDKRWFLQNCVFGLAPSIEEGHPIVGLEFLINGKPLVCSTCAAFDYMYDDGVNSRRVPAQNVDAIAEALTDMASSDLGAMSTTCLERAEGYRWSDIAERYVRFFDHVIAEKSEKLESD